MGPAKKKTAKVRKAVSPPDAAHQFTIVVEEIRAQGKVFGEGLELLREQMQAGFAEVDRRFEQVDRRFEQIDGRFEQIDGRLEQIDGRLGRVEDAVVQHGRELKLHGEQLRAIAEKKVDREEVEAIVERVIARTASR